MNINAFCAAIGSDPLLVQGAGGNVSWKDNDILWVKASGTWLADANTDDIFVPIKLPPLKEAFLNNDFSITPVPASPRITLKPSIETLLHALMPHPVVVHLHAVEILAHLVRSDCYESLSTLLPNALHWTLIDYYKPGAPLAQAIHESLQQNPNIDIVFLKNHGVVIGGNSIDAIQKTLLTLTSLLNTQPIDCSALIQPDFPAKWAHLIPVADPEIHFLALNPLLYNRLSKDWALYPDHIVFLGAKAHTYDADEIIHPTHDLIFVKNIGVFSTATFTRAKLAQLRCYYDVIIRQLPSQALSSLNPTQISELLHWDAEQYRINMEK